MRARLEKAIRMPVMKVLVDFDNVGFGSIGSWTDITDYVTEVSASKQKEGEVLGGVSSDIVTFSVDNSSNAFSPNNPNSFFYQKQKSNIRFVLKAGFKNEELTDYMVGYIQTFKPTWKGKTYTLNATCPIEKLKRAKVPSSSYKNVSWDFLVKELLEQAKIESDYFEINVPKTEITYSYFKFEEEKCFEALKKLMEVVCGVAYFDGFKFVVETQLSLDYSKNKEYKHELLADDFFEFDEEIDSNVVVNKVDITAEPKEICGLEVVVKTPENFTSVDNEITTYDGSGYVYVKNLPLIYGDSHDITIENLTRGGDVTWELWNAEAGRVKLDELGLSNVVRGDSLSINYVYQSLVLLPNQVREYALSCEEEVDSFLEPDVVAWNKDITANIPYSSTPDVSGTISKQYSRLSDDNQTITIALKNNTNDKISISTVQFRGYPVRVNNPIEVHSKDLPSIELYDEKEASISNNYINNIGHAEKLAQFIVDTKTDIPKTLNVQVSGYAELMLGDICLVTEEQSFTNHLMEIQQIDSVFSVSNGWTTDVSLVEVPEGDWTYEGFGGESTVIKPPTSIYDTYYKGEAPPSDTTLIWYNTIESKFFIYDETTKNWIPTSADIDIESIGGVTEEELNNVKVEINTNITNTKNEINTNITNTKNEINTNIANTKTEINQTITNTKTELQGNINTSLQSSKDYTDELIAGREVAILRGNEFPEEALDGQLFVKTDTNDIYRWTGTEWESIGVTNSEKEAIEEEIEQAKSNISEAQQSIANTRQELNNAKQSLSDTQQELSDTKDSLEQTQQELAQTQADLTNTASDLQEQADALKQRATNLEGSVSTINTELDTINGQLDLTATKTEVQDLVDGIAIGGTNLAIYSQMKRYAGGQLFDRPTNYTIEGTKMIATNNPSSSLFGFKIPTNGKTTFVASGLSRIYDTDRNENILKLYYTCYDETGTVVKSQKYKTYDTRVNGTFEVVINDVPTNATYIIIGIGHDFYNYNYYVDRFMFEAGNKATDYSPAPEDTDAKIEANGERITQNTANISVNAERIESVYTELQTEQTTQGNRIASAESSITQNANAIASKVSITEVNNAINNIQIGGRNLILETSTEWQDISVSRWSGAIRTKTAIDENIRHARHYSDYGVNVGDYLTFSVDVNSINKNLSMRVDVWTDTSGSATKSTSGSRIPIGSSGRVTHTIQITEEYPYIAPYIGADGTVNDSTIEQFKCLKVEKGNKATDYTPAPEDTQSQIDAQGTRISSAESSITQLATEIQSKVSQDTYTTDKAGMLDRIESAETTVTQTANSITSVVQQKVTEEVQAQAGDIKDEILGQVNSDYTEFQTRLASAESKIDQKADSVTLTATKTELLTAIDDIEIGGKNLLEQTSFKYQLTELTKWKNRNQSFVSIVEADKDANAIRIEGISTASRIITQDLMHVDGSVNKIKSGEQYTVSGWVKVDAGLTITDFVALYVEGATGTGSYPPLGRIDISPSWTDWHYVEKTITAPDISTWERVMFHIYLNKCVGTVYVKKLKFEKGNKATDWTPAPEDVQNYTDSQINTTKAEIKVTTDGIEQNVSKITNDVSGLTSRVSSAETSIASNANQIALRATKTEMTEAIDNIQIGGRNLIKGTGSDFILSSSDHNTKITRYTNKAQVDVVTAGNANIYSWIQSHIAIPSTELLTVGEYYTYSIELKALSGSFTSLWSGFDVRASSVRALDIRTYSNTEYQCTGTGKINLTPDDGWVRVSGFAPVLQDVTPSGMLLRIDWNGSEVGSSLTWRYPKLEKGNKATDWTLAPEDVQDYTDSSISTAKAEIKVTTDAISQNVSKVTTDVSGLTSRISSAETSIASNADAIALRATKTELTNAINDIEVGGRNYLLNSGEQRTTNGSSYLLYNLSSAKDSLLNKTITVSWEAKKDADATGTANMYAYLRSSSGSLSPASSKIGDCTTEWKRYSVTFDAGTNPTNAVTVSVHFNNGALGGKTYLRNVKCEIGNKATDWTPAPEDVQNYTDTQVNSAKAEIKITTDAITQSVSQVQSNLDGSVEALDSKIDQTANTINLSVQQVQTNLDNLQIGGRNYVLNSDVEKTSTRTTSGNVWCSYNVSEKFQELSDTTFILSADLKAENISADFAVDMYIRTSTTISSKPVAQAFVPSTSYGRFTSEITLNSGISISDIKFVYIRVYGGTGTLYTKNVKLETGNYATDWSPAPEDSEAYTDSAIDTAKAEIKVTTDGITQSVNNSVQSLNSKIDQTAQTINLSVQQVQTNLDNLEIGGKNLLLESKKLTNTQWTRNGTVTDDAYLGATSINKDNTSGTSYIDMLRQPNVYQRLEKGQIYTLSFYAKGTGSLKTYVYPNITDTTFVQIKDGVATKYSSSQGTGGDGGTDWALTSDWVRHTYTFKTNTTFTNGVILFRALAGNNTTVCMPQLEKGNRASDYSVAPEDAETYTDSKITIAEANIEINKEAITSKVDSSTYETDQEGINAKISNVYSELKQTTTDITATFAKATGQNLLRNSCGYEGINVNWSGMDTTYTETLYDPNTDSLGVKSSYHFIPRSTSYYPSSHSIKVEAGETYTLSAMVNLITAGSGFLLYARDVTNNKDISDVYTKRTTVTNGYELLSYTFEVPSDCGEIYARMGIYTNAEVYVTKLMLNKGDKPLGWSSHPEEIHNGIINMSESGIKVARKDGNGNMTGYTIMSHEEFAGYNDTDGDGTFEKIFYLNEDATVSKRLAVTTEIIMGEMKIVPISTNTNVGWAFIPTTSGDKRLTAGVDQSGSEEELEELPTQPDNGETTD